MSRSRRQKRRPEAVALGNRIHEAMQSRQLTQAGLAEQTDMSLASIGNYVRGENYPPVRKLTRIAAVLGVALGDLVGDDLPVSRPRTGFGERAHPFGREAASDAAALLDALARARSALDEASALAGRMTGS